MDPRTVREFVARNWDETASAKRAYWADRFCREGWQSVWTAAQGLSAHARLIQPDFPTARDRERDWLDHAAVRARLDRAAHAFARR